jgi:hypothetical protein
LDKQFDKVLILYNPQKEATFIGENLVLHETSLPISPNAIVAQVIDEKPYVPAGLKESLLLESISPEVEETTAPEELGAARSELRNQKMLIAKIRLSAEVKDGKVKSFTAWNGWSPTPGCRVFKIKDEDILNFLDLKGSSGNVASLGKTKGGAEYFLNLFYMHGVSAILGGRGTGKSHLAKMLALRLIDSGKKVIVFDINDEWSAMRFKTDGSKSPYYDRILKVDPGVNTSFDLGYLGRVTFMSVLKTMRVEEASASMQTVLNAWTELARERSLSLESLIEKISTAQEKVREALTTRLNQLESSGIISRGSKGTTLEDLLFDPKLAKGGLLVVNLKDKTSITQFIIVQLLISKLSNILSNPKSDSLIMILEEAQTYMGHSDIQDIVTRLRHLGLHQIYITNNPQSLQSFLLSHITNWFIYNLANDQDIMYLQNSLPLDMDSANIFIKMLPPKNSLVLINENYQGKNKNYPIIVQVDALPYQTAGVTKELFATP